MGHRYYTLLEFSSNIAGYTEGYTTNKDIFVKWIADNPDKEYQCLSCGRWFSRFFWDSGNKATGYRLDYYDNQV